MTQFHKMVNKGDEVVETCVALAMKVINFCK